MSIPIPLQVPSAFKAVLGAVRDNPPLIQSSQTKTPPKTSGGGSYHWFAIFLDFAPTLGPAGFIP
jgi:hypothetical protein